MEDREDAPGAPHHDPDRGSDLATRLKAAKDRIQKKEQSTSPKRPSELGMGMRIAVDLVVGVFLGLFIGLGLDYLFGTKPWLMILFLFLGSAAGIRNVIKTADELTSRPPNRPPNGADGGS